MKLATRKMSLAAIAAVASFGLFLTATPAVAATNPTAACTHNGASTGTLAGWLFSTDAHSEEYTYGGDCGTVQVRVYWYAVNQPYQWSGWTYNSYYAKTGVYQHTVKGEHDSSWSALVKSF